MQAYGWQAALLITSLPSLLLVVLWWFVACATCRSSHPWVKPAELAELAGNPPYDAAAPLTARRVGRVLGDPQMLLLTLSYLVMNFVFYLVTFWSFLYLVQDRKLSVLESGWLGALPFVVAGIASATGGRIADRLRQRFGDRTRTAHPAVRRVSRSRGSFFTSLFQSPVPTGRSRRSASASPSSK